MFIKGLTVVHRAVRLAWLAATIALLGLIVLPQALPVLGRQLFVVNGTSMQPSIPVGSVIVVRPVDPAEVYVGEVVIFRGPNGTIVTHRVQGISSDGELAFRTKGDASPTADPVAVPASAIVGDVEYTLPVVGLAIAVLGSTAGALTAVGALAGLLVLGWLIERILATHHRQLARLTIARPGP